VTPLDHAIAIPEPLNVAVAVEVVVLFAFAIRRHFAVSCTLYAAAPVFIVRAFTSVKEIQPSFVPSVAPIVNRESVVPVYAVLLSVKNNAPCTVVTPVVTVWDVVLLAVTLPHNISFAFAE